MYGGLTGVEQVAFENWSVLEEWNARQGYGYKYKEVEIKQLTCSYA